MKMPAGVWHTTPAKKVLGNAQIIESGKELQFSRRSLASDQIGRLIVGRWPL
jgi:hypothetical protein